MIVTVAIGGKYGVEVTLDEPGVYPDQASDMCARAVESALNLWAACCVEPPEQQQ